MNMPILALLMFASLVGVPSLPAQPIKLSTVAPDGSPWHLMVRHMGEAWSNASGGKTQLRIYAGGITGDEPDTVRKIRIGQLHAGMLTAQGLTQIVPDVQALQMPLLLSSNEEVDYVKDRLTAKYDALFEAKGFKVLNWGEAGWVYFFAQKPVVRPEDLKPLRLFAWAGDDPAYIDAWKDAGYNPVPIPVTEILTGLQTGLINAFVAAPISALAFQWFGLAKNMTDLKWLPLVGATVMSLKTWQEIPENLRPVLLDSARQASARYKPEVRKLSDESINVMKKHGLAVHSVPREALFDWEHRARAGYQRLVGKVVSAQMVAEVQRLRDEYRARAKSNGVR
ncbi:MAG: TRAP transporter substrate-binding protein DctP [Candidatus Binatia bacterium]